MGTWIKAIPPKMLQDSFGIYHGQWMPEMDRCWFRKEDGTCVSSRLLRTKMGKVEHVTITRRLPGVFISTNGDADFTWADKQEIKDELFGKNRVAIEVFPTEDRMVDVADVYHLWVFEKGFRLPFGIHPKEYQPAVNRGYSMSQADLDALKAYYDEEGDAHDGV